MNNSILVVTLASAVVYGTPLLYAALGELLAERSGVLNLGVEGMMLVGAVMGFWAVQRFAGSSPVVLLAAVGVAALAGASMALIHAFLVITLRANQIVSGLALVIFAFWRPDIVLVGAYLFGAFQALPFTLQARGVTVAPELLQSLPYVMTIVVLVAVSSSGARRRLGAPGGLGVPYVREDN